MKHTFDYLIESMGDQNEEIYDHDLDNIIDEIGSINTEYYFEFAKISIQLGKPQILKYIMSQCKFNKKELNSLKSGIDDYAQKHNCVNIALEFTKILKADRVYIKKRA